MMYRISVNYQDYLNFGYTEIPEEKFKVYSNRAGFYAETNTFGRIRWSLSDVHIEDIPDKYINIYQQNQIGICEIANIFFRNEAATGENGAPIIRFTNEGYSETYEGSSRSSSLDLLNSRLLTALTTYFSAQQISRSIMYG